MPPFGGANTALLRLSLSCCTTCTEREECKATAVATNSPFAEWDKTFGDPRLCAAIADRITFRCTLIQTGTDSYRYQATQDERQSKKR